MMDIDEITGIIVDTALDIHKGLGPSLLESETRREERFSRGDAENAEREKRDSHVKREREMMDIDEITGIIIDTALDIHKGLGPGLLESVYEAVLAKLLVERGLHVDRQKAVSFSYQGIYFEEGFRCDLVVNNCVVVELKSVEKIIPVHHKQLLTYLRLMHLETGLLINFGAPILKEGLHRIVNHHTPSASSYLRVNQNTPCKIFPSPSAFSASPRENLPSPSAFSASPRESSSPSLLRVSQ
ncbi:MAG: GxxExxY protein [bacterium]